MNNSIYVFLLITLRSSAKMYPDCKTTLKHQCYICTNTCISAHCIELFTASIGCSGRYTCNDIMTILSYTLIINIIGWDCEAFLYPWAKVIPLTRAKRNRRSRHAYNTNASCAFLLCSATHTIFCIKYQFRPASLVMIIL